VLLIEKLFMNLIFFIKPNKISVIFRETNYIL